MLSVKEQQTFLKHYYGYYTGAIDGIVGSKTKNAITLFQQNHGLTSDGIWGINTNNKAVSVVKQIQTELNNKRQTETPITNILVKALEGAGVGALTIEKIKAYAENELGENKGRLIVDGIMGNATIEAIKEFQKNNSDLSVDGVAGINTITALFGKELTTPIKVKDWSLYPNFERSEFKCHCSEQGPAYCDGYPDEMETALMEILQAIRNKYNKPLQVTSGVRCPAHNRNVDGVDSSRHKKGKAADFYIEGVSGSELRSLCYALGCRYCYIIVGDTVHVDVY